MNHFDVIIIGGGPAGSIAGIELQKKGINTCIVDKYAFPREKLCGGLLTQKSIDIITQYCPEINQKDFVVEIARKVDFYYKEEKITSFDNGPSYYFTERKKFDTSLILHFKELGGTVIENQHIRKKHIHLDDNCIDIGAAKYSYDYIIGADGCNSVLTERKRSKAFDGFCIEGELKKEHIKDNDFRIYFGVANYGYGWVFPKNDFYTIGIGGDNRDKSIKKFAEQFFINYSSKPVSNVRGALIPSGRIFFYEKLKKNNNLVVGDAAGFIDPITGEGLFYALISGIAAAESIFEEKNSASFNCKKNYRKKVKPIKKNIQHGVFLQKLIHNSFILRTFMNYIKTHHSFANFYMEKVLLTNQYSYASFIRVYLWRYKILKSEK